MTFINTYIPFVISTIIGYLFVAIFSNKSKKISFNMKLFLGGGFGLGLCSHITFSSFLIFNQLNRYYVIALGFVLLLALLIVRFVQMKDSITFKGFSPVDALKNTVLPITLLILPFIPLLYKATFYTDGGWDAWSTWNLKARFLFLGGTNWRFLFDPLLWRSSPHYPLLQPLMNVWGWSFINTITPDTTIFTSIIFTFFTAGLLFTGLKKLTNSWAAILPSMFILTNAFYQKLAYSQYCDLFLGFYLLAALICIIIAKIDDCPSFALFSGISLGFLSFTKPEGLIAALLAGLLSILYLFFKNKSADKKRLLKPFVLGGAVSFIPSLIFYVFYSPKNITFINGLFSTENPITLLRVKTIFAFYFFECCAPLWNIYIHFTKVAGTFNYLEIKWSYIWLVAIFGIFLGIRKCLNSRTIVVGLFFILYNLIIVAYYLINTYFTIDWWAQVTLHRILFSLLPLLLFWSFYSIWQEK